MTQYVTGERQGAGHRSRYDFWGLNNSQEVIETGLFDSYANGGCVEVSEEEARWFADSDKLLPL